MRELKNYVQRAYILADKVIEAELAPEAFVEPTNSPLLTVRIGTTLDEVSRRLIEATLVECGGVKRKAAETLGISLKTLYNRLTAYHAEKTGAPPAPVPDGSADAAADEEAAAAPPAPAKAGSLAAGPGTLV